MGSVQIPRGGNALIDEGPGRLREQLRTIGGLLRQPDHRSEATALFQGFVSDLRNHLGLEEIILRANGYAQLENHARRHTALIDGIAEMVETLTYAPKIRPMEVFDRISDLLLEHVLVEDSDIWPCLESGGTRILTEWTPEMETGVERVDEHHKAMVGHLARLRALPDSAPREDIATQLDSLAQLTTLHFKLEESLWSTLIDDSTRNDAHAQAHARLLDAFAVMAPQLMNGDISLSSFVNDFLAGWLNEHIVHTDQPHFRPIGAAARATRTSRGG